MSGNMAVHFSSKNDDWSTPADFFAQLNKLFNFKLDPCATELNAKTDVFFTKEQNGLSKSWELSDGAVFMNPPYGRAISHWVRKAYETAEQGAPVVCLLPARTDTKWWQQYCSKGLIYFVSGRLKFGSSSNSAPFPCAIVIFSFFEKRRLQGQQP